MTERKELFAPLPMRAMSDSRMKESHLKLLAAIAAHDRMSKNGQGCWAGHKRLADITGIHLKSVSRTLNALAEWGYIEGKTHPLNKRTRVYKVVYMDADGAIFGKNKQENPNETGNMWATAKTEILDDETSEPSDIVHEISCHKLPSDKPNIFCETGIDSVETEIDYAEARASQEKQNGAVSARPSKGFNRGIRAIGQITSSLALRKTVTPLSTDENNRVEQDAQSRLAGMFGHGGDGWNVLLGISDQTRESLIEKELSRTLTSMDIASAMTEITDQQEGCGHG